MSRPEPGGEVGAAKNATRRISGHLTDVADGGSILTGCPAEVPFCGSGVSTSIYSLTTTPAVNGTWC